MTAIRGYECDACKIIVPLGWRTLLFRHGWVMVRQPDYGQGVIPTQHFCRACTERITR